MINFGGLLLEDKEDCGDEAYKADNMVPAQGFVFHNKQNNYGKYRKRDNLLNNFEFPN